MFLYVPRKVEDRRLINEQSRRGAVAVMSSGNIEGDFPIIEVPRMDHAIHKLATLARLEI